MGHPVHRREEVSDLGEQQPEESVTGVGVPNVLLVTTRELQRGDVLGARYQIEAVIGTGGSGRVLRAFDREARTPVALKILRPEFAADPVWAERFSRELRIGRSIIHPNVCRVFDIGDADGHKFLSMELASRGSIRAEVPKIGAMRMTPTRPQRSWPERVADAKAVVDGVAALHAAGIIHRDIKPENILRMEDGRLVVTDFGLATDPGANAGNTVMVGTPSYMAPEVVMGDPATARSDVWGLGIVLHEILFGCRPQWKAMGHGYRRFVPPDDLTTAAQRAAAALCGLCADDGAEVRPASAVDVGTELARALRGKRRFRRPGGRHAVWGALALASFATLGLIRERWSNRAEASRSGAAAPLAERVLTPTGTPEDWSKRGTKLASFAGRLHCYSLVDHGRRVQVIWGAPRRAEDIDLESNQHRPSDLLPETYQNGCPARSPDGKSLLFERASEGGTHVYLSPSPRGSDSHQLVRGSSPEWLPNGQEFVFTVDSRHAAVFSIPTAEMTLVTDENKGPRFIVAHAVDIEHNRLAALYTTENVDGLLVVYALPSLDVVGRVRVPQSSQKLQFGERGEVLLAVDGPRGAAEMVAVDLGTTTLRRMGQVPAWDFRALVNNPGRMLIVLRQLRHDLRVDGLATEAALTTDGESYHGALSPSRDLVFERRLPDGRFVIFYRKADGTEEQATQGPLDATPTFLRDGRSWLYSKVDSGQIFRCSPDTGQCVPIHSDPLVPAFLSVDPSGNQIAYLTMMNATRVRVVTGSNGAYRDFGPTSSDRCAPVWTSTSRFWVADAPVESAMIWSEIDFGSGRRTGRRESASVPNNVDCAIPATVLREISAPGQAPLVIPLSVEASEIVTLTTGRGDGWARPSLSLDGPPN